MTKKIRIAFLALLLPLAPLRADLSSPIKSSASEDSPNLEARVSALETEIAQVKSQANNNSPSASVSYQGGDGLVLSSLDGENRFALRGWIQVQDRDYFGDNMLKLPVDAFLINEARLYAEGSLWGNTGYRLLTDFKAGAVSLLDAYIDYSFLPEHKLTLRVGKFKAPLGLERLQDTRYNEFAELGLPSNLAPNRELGFQLSAYLFDPKLLNLQAAIVNGAQDNASSAVSDTSQTSDKSFDFRAFSLPFSRTTWSPLKKLGLGLAGSFGNRNLDLNNSNASAYTPPSYLSVGQQTIFAYNSGVAVTGWESRLAPQAYWYWNQFGLLGEWTQSYNNVSATPSPGAPPVISQVEAQAWQLEAYWVLTGEDAAFDGVKPRANFNPSAGTWGAFEVLASYGDLQIGQEAFANGLYANPSTSVSEAQQTSLALNWYLNSALKWQLDWDQTWFHEGGGGSLSNPLDREEEQLVLAQIQLSF